MKRAKQRRFRVMSREHMVNYSVRMARRLVRWLRYDYALVRRK